MNLATTIPITEARQRIFEIADLVQKASTHFTLTQYGRPKAVIMSAEEFESWQETLEVMRDFPDLKKDIEEAERDFRSGNYKNYTTLEEILAQDGYVLSDSGRIQDKNDVSRPTQTKRRKRAQKSS